MIGDLDINKIDAKLTEVAEKLKEVQKLEQEQKELKKMRGVVAEFNQLQYIEGKPAFNRQMQGYLSFMRKYPYLSLYKGVAGVSIFLSSYQDKASLELYAKEAEDGLLSTDWLFRSRKWLAEFKKEGIEKVGRKIKNKAKKEVIPTH